MLTKCGCKKFPVETYSDHTNTCTAHPGASKAHDWLVSVLARNSASPPARANGAATWRPDYLRDQAGSRSLVFDLAIAHDRFGSSSQPQQNGCLSHPQDLDAPLRIAAQRKINGYRQDYADKHNISFLPAKSPPPPACTANLCVFFFYRPTRRPKRTSRPLDCHRKNSDLFRHGRAAFYQGLKNKVGLAVAKAPQHCGSFSI